MDFVQVIIGSHEELNTQQQFITGPLLQSSDEREAFIIEGGACISKNSRAGRKWPEGYARLTIRHVETYRS